MLNPESKNYKVYYAHVIDNKKTSGALGMVYDIIYDISDRGGLKQEWGNIDGEIQDEIIDKWVKIIVQ